MAEGDLEYVVQVRQKFDVVVGYEPGTGTDPEKALTALQFAWVDITTVTVPPRTKRRTVLEKALASVPLDTVGVEVGEEVQVRVLPPDACACTPVTLKPRDPELVIGETTTTTEEVA